MTMKTQTSKPKLKHVWNCNYYDKEANFIRVIPFRTKAQATAFKGMCDYKVVITKQEVSE